MRQALARRPVVGSLIVPYMVQIAAHVDFRLLDAQHVDECAQRSLCGVCGAEIRKGKDRAVFLGPLRDLECFDVPWMHEDCADYVIENCPFVSGKRRYYRQPDDNLVVQALTDPYHGQWMRITARRWRADRIRGAWHFQPKVVVTREELE